MTAPQPSGPQPSEPQPSVSQPSVAQPSDSESSEPIDAEIVPDPAPAAVPAPAPDYDEHGVPSLDYVRNKIEGRYATSIGATELAEETVEGRSLAQQEADREEAAKARLAEIRKSLGL